MTGKKKNEAFRLVFEERLRVAAAMYSQRKLTPEMMDGHRSLPKHLQTNLATPICDSILAAEVSGRLAAGSLKLSVAARADALSLEKPVLGEYLSVAHIVSLMADEMEPHAFLNSSAAEASMRRLVLLEEASSKKSHTSVEKTLAKHASFFGANGGLAEKTRQLLG